MSELLTKGLIKYCKNFGRTLRKDIMKTKEMSVRDRLLKRFKKEGLLVSELPVGQRRWKIVADSKNYDRLYYDRQEDIGRDLLALVKYYFCWYYVSYSKEKEDFELPISANSYDFDEKYCRHMRETVEIVQREFFTPKKEFVKALKLIGGQHSILTHEYREYEWLAEKFSTSSCFVKRYAGDIRNEYDKKITKLREKKKKKKKKS
jgi:hypothetical protein